MRAFITKNIVFLACVLSGSSTLADARSELCIEMASAGSRMHELAQYSENKGHYDSGLNMFIRVLAGKLEPENREEWLGIIRELGEMSWIFKDAFTNAEIVDVIYSECIEENDNESSR